MRIANQGGLAIFTDPETLNAYKTKINQPLSPQSPTKVSPASPKLSSSPTSLSGRSRQKSISEEYARQTPVRKTSENSPTSPKNSSPTEIKTARRTSAASPLTLSTSPTEYPFPRMSRRNSDAGPSSPKSPTTPTSPSARILRSEQRKAEREQQKVLDYLDGACAEKGISSEHRGEIDRLAERIAKDLGDADARMMLSVDLVIAQCRDADQSPLENLAAYVHSEIEALIEMLGNKRLGDRKADITTEAATEMRNRAADLKRQICDSGALDANSVIGAELKELMELKKWTTEAWTEIFYVDNGNLKNREISQDGLKGRYAFHVTALKHLYSKEGKDSIWERGLDTGKGGKDGDGACALGGDETLQKGSHIHSQGVVAFALENETIAPYLHMRDAVADLVPDTPIGNYSAVLRFKLNQVLGKKDMEEGRMKPDPMHTTAWLSEKSIPPEHLELLTDGGWMPLQKIAKTALQSLNTVYDLAPAPDRMSFDPERFQKQFASVPEIQNALQRADGQSVYMAIQELKGRNFKNKQGDIFRFAGTTGHPLHNPSKWAFVMDLVERGATKEKDGNKYAAERRRFEVGIRVPGEVPVQDPPIVTRSRSSSTSSRKGISGKNSLIPASIEELDEELTLYSSIAEVLGKGSGSKTEQK